MFNKSVGEILTPDVATVPINSMVSEAIAIMEKNNISCLVAIQNKKPVGILTERDVVWAVYQETDLEKCKVEALMSKPVLTAKSDIDIFEAYELLLKKSIRHLVIVDKNDEIMGVVTQSDIIDNLELEYFVEIRNIDKLMTKNVVTVGKEDFIRDALSKMAEHSISCIVVEEDRNPVGIITERDITHTYHDGKNMKSIKIEEAMNHPVLTVSLDTPVYEAAKTMRNKNIRRLVVVDKKCKIIGLLTQSDIIKGLEGKYVVSLKEVIRIKEEILRETQKDLDEKTLYLDNILRSSTDLAIVATDLDFHIIYYNPVAERIFGYKAEDITGQILTAIHIKEKVDQTRFKKALETVKKEGEYTYTFERKNTTGPRYLESRVSGIWNDGGTLVGYVLMSRDITERKKTEKELQKAHNELEKRVEERTSELKNAYEELQKVDELKSNIIANVSHELRTPLSIANSALELAMDEKYPEERGKLLEVAINALTRQDVIVGNLLEAATIEKNMKNAKLGAVDVTQAIKQECEEFKPKAKSKKLKMKVNIQKNLPQVLADNEQIRRVLHNLIDNAIKFNKEGGNITIEANNRDGKVEVCISDTGIGITEDKHNKIFDRFYQLDSSTKRHYGGTGMGLAVVKEIVESYAGKITVESELSKGSSFCFILPIAMEKAHGKNTIS